MPPLGGPAAEDAEGAGGGQTPRAEVKAAKLGVKREPGVGDGGGGQTPRAAGGGQTPPVKVKVPVKGEREPVLLKRPRRQAAAAGVEAVKEEAKPAKREP